MAETCPFSETSRCRNRDETEALDLGDRGEPETLKNSVSRLSRDRDMSRDPTALVSRSGGFNKKHLLRKLTKMQRLSRLMILSSFPDTPTSVLEILLNIIPIE